MIISMDFRKDNYIMGLWRSVVSTLYIMNKVNQNTKVQIKDFVCNPFAKSSKLTMSHLTGFDFFD